MKRVGGLRRQIDAGVEVVRYEGVSPATLLRDIRQRVIPMTIAKAECYNKQILPALREHGIELITYSETTEAEREHLRAYFQSNVFPILTPLAVDLGHRFPFISNLSTSLGVMLRRPDSSEHLFARVKVPDSIDLWHQIGKSSRYISLTGIIEAHIDELFAGMEILSVLPFRITRNADVEGDDADAEDLLEQIQSALRERRFAPVVRMQFGRRPAQPMLDFLTDELELTEADIYETRGLVNYRSLEQIASFDLPHLHFSPWTPVTPTRLRDREQDIFSVIREGDLLVHHPYESFDDSVERFIEEASVDPNVLCIKQALYRTSGDSEFVRSLIRAAERGKQVAVLVELRARFDEERNIEWARKLEDAGVHVAYGVVGLKTHTKIALVVRKEGNAIRSYCHIGTGNYNASTARLYEDVGLLTCDPTICEDVIDVFNFMTGRSRHHQYKKLLVAPFSMKQPFIDRIRREIDIQNASGNGRIIAKMNQLQDREIIEALYDASAAGVQIDLIVRGFCTLIPGMPGLSENIRLTSIVGRFLEHSRIFWFGRGENDPLEGEFIIGSADWMYRNLHRRVEAAAPIEKRSLRLRLWNVLEACLADHRLTWDGKADGTFTLRASDGFQPDSPEAIGVHQRLMDMTMQASRYTNIDDDQSE